MIGLFAQKIGMTQIFDENGRVFAVTILKLHENRVTKINSKND